MQIAGGKTALYDAFLKALNEMDPLPGRKALILFSDGRDNESRSSLEDVLKALKASDITVFAVGTGLRDIQSLKGRDVLEKITEITGGYAMFPSRTDEIGAMIIEVHSAIESQYAAGYIPPDPSIHKWRKVEIKCKLPGMRLRYRSTYLF
jgi:Ca-activated chloride channel family protein